MTQNESTTRQTFNRLKPYYDRTWDPINQTLHVGIFLNPKDDLFTAYAQATEFLVSRLHALKRFTPKSRVLDVGCGNGKTLLDICAQYGCEGVGVDISDAMIAQARRNLRDLNRLRTADGQKSVRCTFIRGSASQLKSKLGARRFTHTISQDALFMVANKKRLYQDIFTLTKPNGVVGIADFLSDASKATLSTKQQAAIYKFVNWGEGFTLEQYKSVLEHVGFTVDSAQKRNGDMVKTYRLLLKQLRQLGLDDKTYRSLAERYQNIVKAVRSKKMSWGLFFARKV